MRTGLAGTLGLALIGTLGKVAIPIAVQQGIDKGLTAPGGPDMAMIDQDRGDHRRRARHHAVLHAT